MPNDARCGNFQTVLGLGLRVFGGQRKYCSAFEQDFVPSFRTMRAILVGVPVITERWLRLLHGRKNETCTVQRVESSRASFSLFRSLLRTQLRPWCLTLSQVWNVECGRTFPHRNVYKADDSWCHVGLPRLEAAGCCHLKAGFLPQRILRNAFLKSGLKIV